MARGSKVPARWIRTEADRAAERQGCRFDPAPGEHVIEFLEKFCHQSKDPWGGQLLKLLAWQRDFLMRLYGWRRPDDTRRFKTVYLEVAKKNGKSTMVSGLSLYHLFADGVKGADVCVNAFDLQQARMVFDEAAAMVRASPELKGIIDLVPSQKRMVHKASNSTLAAMSAEVNSKDGRNASFVIFDELHRQKTSAMWDVFQYAGRTRPEKLRVSITTAGIDRTSVCWQEHDYSRKVNAGLTDDIGHLGLIYGVDVQEDGRELTAIVNDRKCWRAANPSMGKLFKEADFKADVQKALSNPAQLNNFCRLSLNIWTQAAERYLDVHRWEACGRVTPAAPVPGQACWMGLDLSNISDISALVALFKTEAGFSLILRAWLPEEQAQQRERQGFPQYVQWAREGYITLTPKNQIDYQFIRKEVVELAALYDLRLGLCDSWNSTQILTELIEQDGLPFKKLRQGYGSISAPTKELARLVGEGELHHGNNPLLSWAVDNCVAESDTAGNVKLNKKASGMKIDPVSALVNAIEAYIALPDEGASVYEDRGVLVL